LVQFWNGAVQEEYLLQIHEFMTKGVITEAEDQALESITNCGSTGTQFCRYILYNFKKHLNISLLVGMDECDTAAAVLGCGLKENQDTTKTLITAVEYNIRV